MSALSEIGNNFLIDVTRMRLSLPLGGMLTFRT